MTVNKKKYITCGKKKMPIVSAIILFAIVLGCVLADLICKKDPSYLDLMNYTKAPNAEFWFGTDTLGRDMFSCIWHGGRVSLLIGLASTALSTVIAIVYGAISGIAGEKVDTLLMRFTEIILSIPNLLLIIFLQAIMGKATIGSISVVIGLTSWFGIAKIIRTEVRQLRSSEYVIAAKCMGGSFWAHSVEASGPEFCVVDYVYGGNEYPFRNCSRVNTQLPWNRIATGSDFLGKYAVTGRKCVDDKSVVDHSDSGCFSGDSIDVYYKSWALASDESQSSGGKAVNNCTENEC